MRRAVLLIPLIAFTAQAQEAAPDAALVRELLQRVERLEAEVQQLRARCAGAEPTSAALPAALPPPAPREELALAAPAQLAPEPLPAEQALHVSRSPAGFPEMQLRGFSDVSYHSAHASNETGATDGAGPHDEDSSFALGQFNMFITSQLADRLSILSEVVVDANSENRIAIDLERLFLQYAFNDYLNVSFGRYHTAIGWYNTAYHHAAWLQTATGRPRLFAFSGFLPIHEVGISSTGRIPSGSLGLRYLAEVGNGRRSRSTDDESVQNLRDENDHKAYNVGLFARPEWLPGFQAGFSYYADELQPEGLPNIDESIYAAHAIYQAPNFEWLNEALLLRRTADSGEDLPETRGAYTQVSRRFGAFRPYLRYEYLNQPEDDPVLPGEGRLHIPTLGIRWDFAEFAAFKLQYDRILRRDEHDTNSFTTQLSFTF
ncbi:MAG: hypothetical protein KBD01_06965 [Acidobacteria bacterium]|nr:hypothetical protein [Acidobacteriota bacterium]